jgi:vitamin B12/bleomycin/antimicrobial peptide transport system ATP-binding/permease protein
VLRRFGLDSTLERAGGLDVERDWDGVLSLGDQQLLAVARIVLAAPTFAVLQSPSTTIAPEQLTHVLRTLSEAGITYIVFGGADGRDAYDAVLELRAGGAWGWRRVHRRRVKASRP